MEPDDAYRWPEALQAKRGLGDYPSAPKALASVEFRKLWHMVIEEPRRFSIGRRDADTLALAQQPLVVTRQLVGTDYSRDYAGAANATAQRLALPVEDIVVKCVNVALCADVVADWLGARVIVVSRDVRKVISSWYFLAGFEPEDLHRDPWVSTNVLCGMQVPDLTTRLQKVTWTVAILQKALKATSQSKSWATISHEDLVADPHSKIEEMLAANGYGCDNSVHDFIDSHQRPGSDFETRRSSAQLSRWKERLTRTQWAQVDSVLSHFGA